MNTPTIRPTMSMQTTLMRRCALVLELTAEEQDAYLSRARDYADLECRMRELDRFFAGAASDVHMFRA
jgi:hypothetical protein